MQYEMIRTGFQVSQSLAPGPSNSLCLASIRIQFRGLDSPDEGSDVALGDVCIGQDVTTLLGEDT